MSELGCSEIWKWGSGLTLIEQLPLDARCYCYSIVTLFVIMNLNPQRLKCINETPSIEFHQYQANSHNKSYEERKAESSKQAPPEVFLR